MKKAIKLFLAIISAAIIFTACSTEDNPVIPDPGNGDPDPIVINTPKRMIINEIRVVGFPENKSNGDPWDFSPILPLSR